MNVERFSRQILAFGEEGQKRIGSAKVGIVGAGGIGLQVVQNLAYLGIRDWAVVDDDMVEISNLNRLIGATVEDAENKRPKVDVAERIVRAINPDSHFERFRLNLRDETVFDALTKRDFIFGCVDNDSARMILSELTAAFEIPFIDAAFEIRTDSAHNFDFGGRVVVAIPGQYCLLCANQLDVNIARIELESPPERAFREDHGYGLGPQRPAPSVVSLNAIVAGLATTEFLMLATGLRPPNRMVTYHGMRGVTTVRNDKKKSECLICNSITGKRESADVKRYLRSTLPSDIPS